MTNPHIIKNVSDALSWRNTLSETHPDEILLFRGQRRHYSEIIPSIARDGSYCSLDEIRLISDAHVKHPNIFPRFGKDNALEVLAKLQHYGIPTRLIDLSSNFLVSLYMACSQSQQLDQNNGEVYCWAKRETSTIYKERTDGLIEEGGPEILLYVNLWLDEYIYMNCTNRSQNIPKLFLKEKKLENHVEYGSAMEQSLESVLFIKAPEYFERQKIQAAWYGFFPNKISRFLNGNIKLVQMPDACSVATIPYEHKAGILAELDKMGFNSSTLFPENIDDACKRIADSIKHPKTVWPS